MPFELPAFLEAFTAELRELTAMGLLPPEVVTDFSWNEQSRLHSRVFGALVRAVRRPLVPMVEMNWGPNWCPDVTVVEGADTPVAVIEYESINSSDERMFGKDLRKGFEANITRLASGRQNMPQWWVLISTLPDCRVRRWKMHGWGADTAYPPVIKDNEVKMTNPLAYYGSGLHAYLAEMWQRVSAVFEGVPPTNVAWVNLRAVDDLRVMNVNGVDQGGA